MTATPSTGLHPAVQTLDFAGREMPGFWAQHEMMRAAFRVQTDWPPWCFAPMAVALPLTDDRPLVATKLSALAAWRMTKGIYRVDPTLMAALIATPLDVAVPVDVLLRLPEWCIYLELGHLPTFRGPARGVWVSMEPASSSDRGPIYLQMLLDTERDMATSLDDRAMLILSLKLSGRSILESLQETYPESSPLYGQLTAIAMPVLSMVLYLCSLGAELTQDGVPGRPVLPVAVKTRRRGERLFPAASPVVWDTGVRMGSAMRAAYAAAKQHAGVGNDGLSVAPHLRRAHWHTILSGKRKGVPLELRKRELRWMAPIAVNVSDADQLPATVRPIRSPEGLDWQAT
ncbi:hypothetical protein QTH90_30150 [Variovorax sp. J2P1-59]|uniref:AcrVA2 family anti-CRISPR protein n=1 Tax=Variovorax flavidus TaxID=3053501 RepID=UPI00257881BE|nr:hypothetical protein [Variovorax sp. J2P1-59]MDM0078704.1 hypothetical protein [Variovorax sp. J2P1-59]